MSVRKEHITVLTLPDVSISLEDMVVNVMHGLREMAQPVKV